MFDFKYIKPFDKALIRANTPMVVLATPVWNTTLIYYLYMCYLLHKINF